MVIQCGKKTKRNRSRDTGQPQQHWGVDMTWHTHREATPKRGNTCRKEGIILTPPAILHHTAVLRDSHPEIRCLVYKEDFHV